MRLHPKLEAAIQKRRRPDRVVLWAYLILAATCFWNMNGISALVFKQGQIFSLVMLICGLIILARGARQIYSTLTPLLMTFLIFMTLFIGVGAISNPEPKYIITYCNTVFLVVCSALAVRVLVPRMGLTKFLGATTISLCMGAWTVFLSPLLFDYYRLSESAEISANAGRFLGFFTNPNNAGLAADMAAVACFAMLTLPRKNSGLLITAIVITGFGAVLTFSRGALLTLAGIGIGYLGFTAQLGRRGIGVLISGMILLGVSYWFFTGGYEGFEWTPQQLRRIKSMEKIMTFQEVDESDTGGRLIGARAGLEYWSESPVIGHGLGNLHAMPDDYFGGVGCHNMHVTVLGESGLLGGIPYVLFLIFWVINSLACRNQTIRAFSLGMAFIYVFFGMVSHGILDQRSVNMAFGVCIGLLGVAPLISSHSQSGMPMIPPQALGFRPRRY